MKKEYSSGFDRWVVSMLCAAPVLLIAMGIMALNKSMVAGLVQAGIGLAIGALIFACTMPCRYLLDTETLVIKCGLFDEVIPITSIKKIEFCSSYGLAPALSSKRIRLTLQNNEQREISPFELQEFAQALESKLASANQGAK